MHFCPHSSKVWTSWELSHIVTKSIFLLAYSLSPDPVHSTHTSTLAHEILVLRQSQWQRAARSVYPSVSRESDGNSKEGWWGPPGAASNVSTLLHSWLLVNHRRKWARFALLAVDPGSGGKPYRHNQRLDPQKILGAWSKKRIHGTALGSLASCTVHGHHTNAIQETQCTEWGSSYGSQ